MDFVIDKNILGTPFNLHYKNGTFVKVDKKPNNVFEVNTKDFWIYAKLYGFEIPYFPSKKYVESIKPLLDNNKDIIIPWHNIIPTEIYKTELKTYTEKLKNIFENMDTSYVENVYKKHNLVFESIKPVKINTNKFLENLDKNFGDSDSIKTFVPENGFCEKVYYDRLSTVTGRLTVYKGPNILNVKKEYRKMFESRFGSKGKVYYLDYSSLEPRVLLATNKKNNIPQDIYSFINKELDIDIPRNIIKQVILSKIYGGSDYLIKKQVNNQIKHVEDIIDLITEYFSFEENLKTLTEKYYNSPNKVIYNHYGRPILCNDIEPYKLINYYIQSTAAEVALFGYLNILEKVKKVNLENYIVPVFLLHDGIFLDIHNNCEFLVEKICKAGSINIPKFENINFYLKVEDIFM